MKKDDLEAFIDKNRDAFDDVEPTADLWKNIERDLEPSQSSRSVIRRVLQYAAVLIAVGGLGYWLALQNNATPTLVQDDSAEVGPFTPVSLSDISPELAEVEHYYTSEVNEMMGQLDDYDLDEEVGEELQILQEEFENLKQEMGRGAQRQKILEAMIENYRLRLQILEDLLEELKKKEHDTIRKVV